MKKEAEFAPVCARIVELQDAIKAADDELKGLKAGLLEEMNSEGLDSDNVGDFLVTVTHVAEGLTVDSAKMKKAGIYEQYAKKRAAYDRLDVKRRQSLAIPESELGFANA